MTALVGTSARELKKRALSWRVRSPSTTARVRDEKGAWLVEADVAVGSDAQDLQVDPACCQDGRLIGVAGVVLICRVAVGDMDTPGVRLSGSTTFDRFAGANESACRWLPLLT